jgi:HSP20 family molecular chaperone IbpA
VLPLPTDIKHEGIEAEMSKGVLTVRIPKAEQTSPTEKNIPIQAS